MKAIRSLFYGEIAPAVAYVAVAFLSLFFFVDFVDELGQVGRTNPVTDRWGPYNVADAAIYILLLLPNYLYQLLPIAVLIGAVFVMTRMAQYSEFTILRTSGMGPKRALKIFVGLGLLFTVLTFLIGEYVTPIAGRTAQLHKARFTGQISIGQTGAWLREGQRYSNFAVNVGALDADGMLRNIRILEFDSQGTVLSNTFAQSGKVEGSGWSLQNVQRYDYYIPKLRTQGEAPKMEVRQLQDFHWPTEIDAQMVSVALLQPDRMDTWSLFKYIRHLDSNAQDAQRYEIEFWRKIFYPLSCVVMLMLALPFGYLQLRNHSSTGFIFAGIMIGISFFITDSIFYYFGNINNWSPWFTAAAPSLIYCLLALGLLFWRVFRH